jgi:ribosomal protein S8
MTLAVDVLANAIRSNPHTTRIAASTLAERYLRALHAAGYIVAKRTDTDGASKTAQAGDGQ